MMSAERAAYEYLHGTSASTALCTAQREHALRVRDLVAEIGGVERDRVAALLHEAFDHGLDPAEALGEEISSRARDVADCLPDFLRHDETEIAARSERLMKSPVTIQILWLCDVIDTFESPIVRLTGMTDEEFEVTVAERCKAAQRLAQRCANHPRFASLLARARAAITDVAMKVRVKLLPMPPPKGSEGADISPGM